MVQHTARIMSLTAEAAPRGAVEIGDQAVAPSKHSIGQLVLAAIVVGYLLTIVWLWIWMVTWGDRTWLATLFLFGPRWLCAMPWPALALAAGLWKRWLLAPLAVTGWIILFPIMGFEIHLPRIAGAGVPLRVMTCNVDERRFSVADLAELIVNEQPDVVALQEVRERTPFVWPADWHVIEQDEFILASRWPIAMRERLTHDEGRLDLVAIRFTVQLPDREVQVFNTHLTSPRAGIEAVLNSNTIVDTSQAVKLTEMLAWRAKQSRRTADWIASFAGPKIVLGDFNTPVESAIFRRDWSWLTDSFDSTGLGFGFTKRSEAFGISYGSRIDHVLADDSWRVRRCWVGADVGSDHWPLLAELE